VGGWEYYNIKSYGQVGCNGNYVDDGHYYTMAMELIMEKPMQYEEVGQNRNAEKKQN